MAAAGMTTLNEKLTGAPAFKIQVLTAAELDSVAGGPFSENQFAADCSCTVSQCHVDGNNEPGTS